MAINIVKEGHRCYQCKKPKCREACPVDTPIPQMIDLFLNGKSDEAGKILFENNPLSLVCALVCDHGRQCEGNCIRNKKDTPVLWSEMEAYISSKYLEQMEVKKPEIKHGQRVAIIGSGPAGITLAVALSQKGYDITIFDSKDKLGGVLRYGIPEFRLPKKILDKYAQRLREMGILFRPNTSIGGALTVDDLFRDGYEAVFIGTGVWRPKKLDIVGESLGNVHYGIDYLVNPEAYNLGEKVAIIGAGNSAVDVARTAIRQGAREVTLYARSLRIAASDHEVEYAIADGVHIAYGMGIKEITSEGPVFMKNVYDEEGNVIEIKPAKLYEADSTIIAVSQGPKDKIVNTTNDIKTNEHGLVQTDEGGSTTREGVFASGDVVKGAKTVVEAVKYSKIVAETIDAYLTKKREEK